MPVQDCARQSCGSRAGAVSSHGENAPVRACCDGLASWTFLTPGEYVLPYEGGYRWCILLVVADADTGRQAMRAAGRSRDGRGLDRGLYGSAGDAPLCWRRGNSCGDASRWYRYLSILPLQQNGGTFITLPALNGAAGAATARGAVGRMVLGKKRASRPRRALRLVV